MNTIISGVQGYILRGSLAEQQTVAGIDNFQVALTNAIQTGNHFGNRWDNAVGGTMSGTVALSGDFDDRKDAEQLDIINSLIAGETDYCEFYTRDTRKISGNIIWNNVQITDAHTGKVTVSLNGTFDGEPAIFNAVPVSDIVLTFNPADPAVDVEYFEVISTEPLEMASGLELSNSRAPLAVQLHKDGEIVNFGIYYDVSVDKKTIRIYPTGNGIFEAGEYTITYVAGQLREAANKKLLATAQSTVINVTVTVAPVMAATKK